MAGEKWNSINVNFSGANRASANASKALSESAHTLNNVSRSMKDRVDTYNKEVKEQKRYNAQLDRQVQADKYTKFNAESKGYGQGQLVADAMSGLTGRGSGTNVLDNTTLMNNLNSVYDSTEDKKVTEYVTRLDAGGTLSDAEAKDYETRVKAAEANTASLNEVVLRNVTPEELYKADATTAQNAVLNQLMSGGVNPQYAATMAETLATDYTKKATPELTEVDKAKIKSQEAAIKIFAKNTDTTTVGTGSGTGNRKKSSSYHNGKKAPNTLKQKAAVLSYLDSVSEDGKFDNYWTTLGGERSDAQAAIEKLQEPVTDSAGNKYYLSDDDISNYFGDKLVDNNWVAGTTLANITNDKSINAYRVLAAEEYKSGNTGRGGSRSTSTSSKRLSKGATAATKNSLGIINSILAKYSGETGSQQLTRLLGDTTRFKGAESASVTDNTAKPSAPVNALMKALGTPGSSPDVAKLKNSNPGLFNELYTNSDAGVKARVDKALSSSASSKFLKGLSTTTVPKEEKEVVVKKESKVDKPKLSAPELTLGDTEGYDVVELRKQGYIPKYNSLREIISWYNPRLVNAEKQQTSRTNAQILRDRINPTGSKGGIDVSTWNAIKDWATKGDKMYTGTQAY